MQLKLDIVKNIVERVMQVDEKLDVMANSWPLYFVLSMFLNSYFNEIEGIVNNFFETVYA
jgi:regulator of RNase E activity RraB